MSRNRELPALLMLIVTLLAWAASRAAGDSISRIMGSIAVSAGEHAGDLGTVNGSIDVGDNAVVGHARTVNGSIRLAEHASAAELETVNGAVRLHEGARVAGSVRTVNGSLSLDKDADVGERLGNVNGSIHVHAAHVGGDIDTVSGSLEIGPDARVDGGIQVHKDNSSELSPREPPLIVIGPGSIVKGTLKFERPVQLYVSDRARIGAVEGATPVKFSGDRPPEK